MNAVTFSAFRSNGTVVQLAELLAIIPENKLVWSITDFRGIGRAPNNLLMNDFEEQTRTKPNGFIISWPELNKFAKSLDQAINCIVVGAKSERDILNGLSAGNNFKSCEIVLDLFDSTEWSVWARDEALMKRLAAVY